MKKILLIEDNPDIRENTAEILQLAGYDTMVAADGKAGVEMALTTPPDLIICDIMMPVLDGYGVLHLLGKNVQTQHVPFIFLTAKTEKTDMRRGMEMGADDYITKPFDDIELLKAVETRLKKNALLQQAMSKPVKTADEFLMQIKTLPGIGLNTVDHEVHTYKKKQLIYSASYRAKDVFYIVSGKVKTYMIHDDGKEFITSILTTGDFFGYIPVLEDTAYADYAETLDDSEIMLIPREDFLAMMYHDPKIREQLIVLLTKNVKEKEEKLMALAYSSIRKRVAALLIELHDKFNAGKNTTDGIEIPRETLAQAIGTAKESLIRTLSDFKNEHLIDIRENRIIILEEKTLRHLPY